MNVFVVIYDDVYDWQISELIGVAATKEGAKQLIYLHKQANKTKSFPLEDSCFGIYEKPLVN